ncbi:D-ribitol-5-phosphate cytidylyltransferase-like isoform X2 [Centruroides vittatus]
MYKYLSEYSPENFKKLHVTIGSSTRHKSIYCGLQALEKIDKSIEVVIIHDGVRPVIPQTILEEVVMAAKTYGAAGVIRPLVSTVISQDEEKLLDVVLDRTKYYASEMPQAFTFNMILDAYSKCSGHDLDVGTECLQIAKDYGNIRAYLVVSDYDLWKVTYKKDLYATEGILKEGMQICIKTDGVNNDFLECMKYNLSKTFKNVKVDKNKVEDDFITKSSVIQFHKNKSLMQVVNEDFENSTVIKNTVVHLVVHSEFRMDEHFEISKKVKELVKLRRIHNSFIYYVCLKNDDWISQNNHVCEIIADLLFSNSSALSGQIFYV